MARKPESREPSGLKPRDTGNADAVHTGEVARDENLAISLKHRLRIDAVIINGNWRRVKTGIDRPVRASSRTMSCRPTPAKLSKDPATKILPLWLVW